MSDNLASVQGGGAMSDNITSIQGGELCQTT